MCWQRKDRRAAVLMLQRACDVTGETGRKRLGAGGAAVKRSDCIKGT